MLGPIDNYMGSLIALAVLSAVVLPLVLSEIQQRREQRRRKRDAAQLRRSAEAYQETRARLDYVNRTAWRGEPDE